MNYFKIYLIAVAVMSVVAFIAMGSDKKKAKKGVRRTPEKTLFLYSILLGAIGGTAGMYFFRHKTKHWYFALGFPVLAVLQIALGLWLGGII